MKNLELYAGLLAGGLGTGYNLYQGDSLTNSLAQGAIVGTAVGGGIGLTNKLYNAKIFNPLPYRQNKGAISLKDKLDNYLHPDPYTKYRPYDEALDNAVDDIKEYIEDLEYDSLDEQALEDLKDTLEQTRIIDSYYYLEGYNSLNRKNVDNIMDNVMPKVVYGTGAGTGLIGGMSINNLFQDKSEREQAQLLSELELLKANGSISPYLDDYLMRNI